MATTTGSQLVIKALQHQGVSTYFYLPGGPMTAVYKTGIEAGMQDIAVRHEQAAAMAANAYARVTGRPGVCMAASGPGVTNLVTGIANALVDAAPVVALGGAASLNTWGRESFQEMEQLEMFRPITKWSERVYHTFRVPELVEVAFRQATSGKPGPVYLDLPGDILYAEVEDDKVAFPEVAGSGSGGRLQGDPDGVKAAVRTLAEAKRPLVLTGSGVLWSRAGEQLRRFVDTTGIPFYTTPQGRGVIPDDHDLSFLAARSTAFREADCVLVVGTRFNYMLNYGKPPRFAAHLKVIRVDIDPTEIGRNRAVDVGIVGDAGAVLAQLAAEAEGKLSPRLYSEWVERMRGVDRRKRQEGEVMMSTDQVPIHPLRLCKEIRDYLDRDAILAVDGHEILNFARQSIPTYVAGHRLNAGPMGCLGVALPFAIGAQVAKPGVQVVALHGDGSFGLNAMELDTAARYKLPVVTVISTNGGWESDPELTKPGRQLGYPHYEKIGEAFGCHTEFVEQPEQIRPALERSFKSGLPAIVNVITDYRASATTQRFTAYAGPPPAF